MKKVKFDKVHFHPLNFKGMPVLSDESIINGVSYYNHVYQTNGFVTSDKDPQPKKRHACLRTGNWCWSNALSNPLMAIRFLWRRL